jgi:dihydroorotate dehydrogenase electron transfer subunit
MFWIPGVSENPISFSGDNEITVRKVCEEDEPGTSFSERLFEMPEGDFLLARGPYGRPFHIGSRNNRDYKDVIIAGGCGAAPLRLLAKAVSEEKKSSNNRKPLQVLLGATTADGLLFREDYLGLTDDVMVFTDDGSYGRKGMVTEGIRDMGIDADTRVYICGPERMMAVAAEEALKDGATPEYIQLSVERYMKCGVGLCGSCECGGHLVCQKGPVFPYNKLMNTDFGVRRRTRTGAFADV